MERTCGHCGASLAGRSSRARYCSDAHRALARRGVPAAAAADPGGAAPAEGGGDDEPKRPAYRQRRRKIADEVEARLRDAGMLDTWQASQVLDLADALDWQGGSLSARASAHRELERQMSELLRGRDEPGSGVGEMRDEVRERRERRAQRRAGAGA